MVKNKQIKQNTFLCWQGQSFESRRRNRLPPLLEPSFNSNFFFLRPPSTLPLILCHFERCLCGRAEVRPACRCQMKTRCRSAALEPNTCYLEVTDSNSSGGTWADAKPLIWRPPRSKTVLQVASTCSHILQAPVNPSIPLNAGLVPVFCAPDRRPLVRSVWPSVNIISSVYDCPLISGYIGTPFIFRRRHETKTSSVKSGNCF